MGKDYDNPGEMSNDNASQEGIADYVSDIFTDYLIESSYCQVITQESFDMLSQAISLRYYYLLNYSILNLAELKINIENKSANF